MPVYAGSHSHSPEEIKKQHDTAFLNAAAVEATRDKEFQSELLNSFMQTGPETLNALRKALQDFTKAQPDSSRSPSLL